ncbi:hypothetical protein LPB19_08335 [Marinobacter salinisoli]|uniref:7TM-DISM receptor extracellular domain-containing protein n=1 Tax=Marinobacter salinisoli TaxID=2769486 RepID=A0ABX7MW39_9GAMM|nr:hypothetical protein [Marinobacter salinisoli]QSP96368.1 hypothetical protein LPB19_08335 [Marinobacter salinisoli]
MRRINRRRLLSAAVCTCLLVLATGVAQVSGAEPAPDFDLRDKRWGAGEVHTLDGHWQFSRGAFIDPSAPHRDPQARPTDFAVPGFWNEPPLNQETFGFGTLHTRVQVPPDQTLYLAVSDIPAAYRLFVNGELLTAVGRPARTKEQEIPQFLPRVVPLETGEGLLDIVIHLSNHHYKQGGIRRSVQITDESGYLWLKDWPLVFDLFLSSSLITIGLVLLALRLRGNGARAAPLLGLFSIVIGTRALLVGERILYRVDWLSWQWLQKLEHVLLYFGVSAFTGYLFLLYAGHMHRALPRVTLLCCGVLALFTIALPTHLATQTVTPFKWGALALCGWFIAVYLPRLRELGPGWPWFYLSMAVLTLTLPLDLIMNHWQIHNRPVMHWSLILFVVFQVVYLWRLQDAALRPSRLPSGNVMSWLDPVLPRPALQTSALAGQHPEQPQRDTTPAADARSSVAPGAAARKAPSNTPEDTRAVLVELLRRSLNLWERHSGKSKIQLAEDSGCWRVYLDGSTPKTRTLDKYLNERTLPRNPRWRLVVRTANHVIAQCPLAPQERSELERLIARVEHNLN